jgi:uncharacterized protein YdaU (DUF1376 family)
VNYFEFWTGDYLRDTSRLALVDHGVYLKLMIAYYSEERALPADHADLYQIAVAITPAEKASVRKVAELFFPIAADGLRHKNRIDEEIAKAQKRIQIARENGAKNKPGKNPPAHPAGRPVGDPSGGPAGDPHDTQRHTRSGEALHTPHATTSVGSLEAHTQGDTSARRDAGVCDPTGSDGSDGQAPPPPRPEVAAAIALRARGLRITSDHPTLLDALREGVTLRALDEMAEVYPGKSAGYVIAAARRQHAEAAAVVSVTQGQPRAGPASFPLSKSAAAFAALGQMADHLEALAHGHHPDPSLVLEHDSAGPAAPVRAEPGPHPRK